MYPDLDTLHCRISAFMLTVATPESMADDPDMVLHHALRLTPGYLAKAFNNRAVPSPVAHVRPAQALENKAARHGLSVDYHFPRELDGVSIESYAIALRWARDRGRLTYPQYERRLHDICDALCALNPSLIPLRDAAANATALYHLTLGVTSGFNVNDIRFFMNGNTFMHAMRDKMYAEKTLHARRLCNVENLGWVPAPETLDKIISQRNR